MYATVHSPTIHIDHSTYPAPDPGFRSTELTDALAERIRRVRDNEAELAAAGYFVLHALEESYAGGHDDRAKRKVGERLAVDLPVLKKLGELAARRDPVHGRKFGTDSLSPDELEWIRAAMVRLTRRVGEVEAGADPRLLSLADLPLLP